MAKGGSGDVLTGMILGSWPRVIPVPMLLYWQFISMVCGRPCFQAIRPIFLLPSDIVDNIGMLLT
jgi:NAD(P)H-hydrate repair Nnr-like enzyme with NAD(P)H-hydrate dehydratase domain